MIPDRVLVASLAVALVTAGCGGGGGGSSTVSAPTHKQNVGPLQLEFSGTGSLHPVVSSTQNVVLTGIAGPAITGLTINMPALNPNDPANLLNTIILFSRIGRPCVLDYRTMAAVDLVSLPAIYGNSCTPSRSSGGSRMVTSEYLTGSKASLIATNLDGTSRTTLFSDSTSRSNPELGPTGWILYQIGSRIYKCTLAGASETPLTSATDYCSMPTWEPSGARIGYIKFVGGHYLAFSANSDGTGEAQLPIGATEVYGFRWSPDGKSIAANIINGSASQVIMQLVSGEAWHNVASDIGSLSEGRPSWSPDSRKIVFSRTVSGKASLWQADVHGFSSKLLYSDTGGDNLDVVDPFWGAYPTSRTLIGSGGVFGATASGFIVSQAHGAVTGTVGFDSTTRAGTTITAQDAANPYQTGLVMVVTAPDKLTSLYYSQSMIEPAFRPITAVNNAKGAIVAFDGATGRVQSVLTFGGTESTSTKESANVVTYRANFLGQWDGQGRNLQPNGYHEATINTKTGKVLTVR